MRIVARYAFQTYQPWDGPTENFITLMQRRLYQMSHPLSECRCKSQGNARECRNRKRDGPVTTGIMALNGPEKATVWLTPGTVFSPWMTGWPARFSTTFPIVRSRSLWYAKALVLPLLFRNIRSFVRTSFSGGARRISRRVPPHVSFGIQFLDHQYLTLASHLVLRQGLTTRIKLRIELRDLQRRSYR